MFPVYSPYTHQEHQKGSIGGCLYTCPLIVISRFTCITFLPKVIVAVADGLRDDLSVRFGRVVQAMCAVAPRQASRHFSQKPSSLDMLAPTEPGRDVSAHKVTWQATHTLRKEAHNKDRPASFDCDSLEGLGSIPGRVKHICVSQRRTKEPLTR